MGRQRQRDKDKACDHGSSIPQPATVPKAQAPSVDSLNEGLVFFEDLVKRKGSELTPVETRRENLKLAEKTSL
jgi:hypothetical protein